MAGVAKLDYLVTAVCLHQDATRSCYNTRHPWRNDRHTNHSYFRTIQNKCRAPEYILELVDVFVLKIPTIFTHSFPMGHQEEDEQENAPLESAGDDGSDGPWSAMKALEQFDSTWYARTSHLGRWMDVIGDFAGEELFVLNGDSLLSLVLDDPLLALGKDSGK
jgi:hypothetical protein